MDNVELIKPKITEDSQVLAALASTGAGFEALGGSSLMLTEPVENSVDSIIEANKKATRVKGVIRIFIDRKARQIVVVDNGLGFVNPRHICEKPFDSLKKYDPDLTGKFARGLQGFRSYCSTLVFITRRLNIPDGEVFGGESGNTVRLEFKADRIEVGAAVEKDERFFEWSWGEFHHGAVALYSDWKPGEFEKIRKEKLIRRIERHFGELIRKGEIEILVWEGEGLAPALKIPREDFYECKPIDYSGLTEIDLPHFEYTENGAKKGEVIFELYLSNRAKRDRDSLPFVMYRNRPVGDAPISEIGEFSETDVWNSWYLTGFIRADFCDINELRLALKPGLARDFLYQKMEEVEPVLRERIKKHHLGLIDLRRSQEINQLVNKLQSFLKQKGIFHFKTAKELGQLSTGEQLESLKVSKTAGSDSSLAAMAQSGEVVIGAKPICVASQDNVIPGQQQGIYQPQDLFGGSGQSQSEKTTGGPGDKGQVSAESQPGYRDDAGGLGKSLPVPETAVPGDASAEAGRQVKRRKPRGFNLSLWPDEFSEELSTFDTVNSTVIINSAHERYRKRDDPDNPLNREMVSYVSELYIWEICKLAGKENPDMNLTDVFLKTKYEFFEDLFK